MKLVPHARLAWRWFSVQAMALAAILPLAWEALPPELRTYIPEPWMPWIVAGVLVGGIAGRLVDQGTAK